MCIKWNKWGLPSHEAEHVSKREMSNILKLVSWGFRHSYYPNGNGSWISVPIIDRLLCRSAGRRWDCKAEWAYLCLLCVAKERGVRNEVLKEPKHKFGRRKVVECESAYEEMGFWEGWEVQVGCFNWAPGSGTLRQHQRSDIHQMLLGNIDLCGEVMLLGREKMRQDERERPQPANIV